MEYTTISGTDIEASRMGLGTWAIGGWMWGGEKKNEPEATIHAALDRGINLIDTAPVYGQGRSEELVGEALQSYGKRSWIDPASAFHSGVLECRGNSRRSMRSSDGS